MLHEDGRRPLAVKRHRTRHALQRSGVVSRRLEEAADRGFATAQHTVERPVGVAEQLLGGEGGAVATSEDEAVGQPLPCHPDEVEDSGTLAR